MKGCVRFVRELRRRWIFVVCDWLVSLIPSLLSLFVVMFFFVLFSAWYFSEFSWWLVSVDVVLIACMVAVTVIFAIGSREISLKIKPSRQYKSRAKASG